MNKVGSHPLLLALYPEHANHSFGQSLLTVGCAHWVHCTCGEILDTLSAGPGELLRSAEVKTFKYDLQPGRLAHPEACFVAAWKDGCELEDIIAADPNSGEALQLLRGLDGKIIPCRTWPCDCPPGCAPPAEHYKTRLITGVELRVRKL